ncbi:MAG: gamma carbonic anhydrase family protein [Rhodocyclaceae bacterium]|nr:gamma carbonic anhydrase family protein [Rhodocyclaceae bacterium]
MAIYRLGDRTPVIGKDCWIADSASVVGSVVLGDNANIWFSAVLRGDNDPITIGANTNIQDGSVLHTDEGVPLTIGDNVTIGHMVMLHGCTIGEGSLIGINAVVLNKAVIGKHCIIGANTLIPEGKVVPDRSLVVGSPGRIIRKLSDEDLQRLMENASGYVANAHRFERELERIDG